MRLTCRCIVVSYETTKYYLLSPLILTKIKYIYTAFGVSFNETPDKFTPIFFLSIRINEPSRHATPRGCTEGVLFCCLSLPPYLHQIPQGLFSHFAKWMEAWKTEDRCTASSMASFSIGKGKDGKRGNRVKRCHKDRNSRGFLIEPIRNSESEMCVSPLPRRNVRGSSFGSGPRHRNARVIIVDNNTGGTLS